MHTNYFIKGLGRVNSFDNYLPKFWQWFYYNELWSTSTLFQIHYKHFNNVGVFTVSLEYIFISLIYSKMCTLQNMVKFVANTSCYSMYCTYSLISINIFPSSVNFHLYTKYWRW